MSSLPTEIITDVLLRLPVRTLLRFRCVSKPWCFLIDGPDFIKHHLRRSIDTDTNTSLILRHVHFYSVDFDSQDSVYLDLPVNFSSYITEMLGSCNGLVCVCDDNYIAFWNPSTRKHHALPVSPVQISGFKILVYGFGYDEINDDYKLLRIVQYVNENDGSYKSEVVIFSLRMNEWRKIEDFPYHLCYRREWGVFVSGALHWAVTPLSPSSEKVVIVAFDLESEKYRVVPHPDGVDNNTYMNVGVLGGCLSVICSCFRVGLSIWVMKEYGVKESWVKLISIAPDVISYFAYVRPLAYSKDGNAILLERELPDGVKLIWYDLKKKTVKNAKFRGVPKSFEAMFFVGSLVPLNNNAGIETKKRLESKEGAKNKNRKKRDDFLSVGFKLVL